MVILQPQLDLSIKDGKKTDPKPLWIRIGVTTRCNSCHELPPHANFNILMVEDILHQLIGKFVPGSPLRMLPLVRAMAIGLLLFPSYRLPLPSTSTASFFGLFPPWLWSECQARQRPPKSNAWESPRTEASPSEIHAPMFLLQAVCLACALLLDISAKRRSWCCPPPTQGGHLRPSSALAGGVSSTLGGIRLPIF